MDETKKGTEAIAPTIPPEEDPEVKFARLEAEKIKLTEEKENYRKAYLKEAEKKGEPIDGDEDARIRRVVQEEVATSRFAEIAREQEELIRLTLKENKELKLAHLGKPSTPPAAIGAHSESAPVKDTLITDEQMAVFKSKGWTDKDIERYKKNLSKRV